MNLHVKHAQANYLLIVYHVFQINFCKEQHVKQIVMLPIMEILQIENVIYVMPLIVMLAII